MSLSLYFKHIRCPKTTVDPERGVKDGHEPLETLRKWGNDIITNLQITSLRTADAFPVVASLPPKNSVAIFLVN